MLPISAPPVNRLHQQPEPSIEGVLSGTLTRSDAISDSRLSKRWECVGFTYRPNRKECSCTIREAQDVEKTEATAEGGNSTLQPSAEARQGMNVQSFSSQLSSTGASRNADIAGNPTAVTSFPDLVTKVVPYVKPIIIAFDNDRAKRRAGTEQVRFRTHHFEARLSRGPDAGEWTIDATEVPPDIATLRKAGLKAAANGTCTYNGSSKDGDSAAEKEKCTRNFQEAVSSKGKTLDGYLNDDTDHRLVADYGDQNTSLLCVHDAFASGLKQSSRLNRRGKQVKPSWIEIERRDLSEHGASAQSVSADPNSSAGVISDHPGAFRMANIRRFNEDQSDYLRDPDYLAQLNLSKRLFSAWPPENVETTATWHDGDLAAEVGPPSNYYWHRKDRGKVSCANHWSIHVEDGRPGESGDLYYGTTPTSDRPCDLVAKLVERVQDIEI